MPDAADIIGGLNCPLPRTDHDCVLLGHGSGGRMSADLLQRIFLPAFDNAILGGLEDQATVFLPSPPVGHAVSVPGRVGTLAACPTGGEGPG